jgi:hypothetical protein
MPPAQDHTTAIQAKAQSPWQYMDFLQKVHVLLATMENCLFQTRYEQFGRMGVRVLACALARPGVEG